MAEILTSKYKTDVMRLFYDDLLLSEYYYLIASVDTEITQRTTAVNAQASENLYLEKVLFGKKVAQSDVQFMIKYYPWQEGQIFVQYDDAIDLEDQKFYAVVGPNVNDTGDYRVYKCLYNNNGKAVTSPPNFIPGQADQIYETADGYRWKYMYYITQADFEAYNAIGYIPILGDFEVDPTANSMLDFSGSSLDQIIIENPEENQGYFYLDGKVSEAPDDQGGVIITSLDLSEITNYYTGMSMYVTDTLGVSHLREVTAYEYDNTNGVGRFTVKYDIDNPRMPGVAKNGDVTIYPTVKIRGDGYGAKAIPTINQYGIMTSVRIIDPGDDYIKVDVSIVDPLYDFNPEAEASIEVRANARGILSPRGGHGANPIDEFKCRHILLYGYITEGDNEAIGALGSYSYVGLVKNPEWANTVLYETAGPNIFDNRIAITTNDVARAGELGTLLTQLDTDNEIVFTGLVHEIDYSANTIYLNDYMGPYENQANSDISLSDELPFVNPTGQLININTPVEDNIVRSPYLQRTGEVYFFEDFFPLNRSVTSREEFKLVLEF